MISLILSEREMGNIEINIIGHFCVRDVVHLVMHLVIRQALRQAQDRVCTCTTLYKENRRKMGRRLIMHKEENRPSQRGGGGIKVHK